MPTRAIAAAIHPSLLFFTLQTSFHMIGVFFLLTSTKWNLKDESLFDSEVTPGHFPPSVFVSGPNRVRIERSGGDKEREKM